MKSLKTTLWLMFLPVILFFYAAEATFFFFERVWWNIHDRFTRRRWLEAELFLLRLPEEEFERGLEQFRLHSLAEGYPPKGTDATIRLLRERKRNAGDII